jgi:hypothetical protein
MTLRRFVIADFLQTLENLNVNQLLQMMQSFLSKGITAGQKGFEQMAHEVKVFREEKNSWRRKIASCVKRTRS